MGRGPRMDGKGASVPPRPRPPRFSRLSFERPPPAPQAPPPSTGEPRLWRARLRFPLSRRDILRPAPAAHSKFPSALALGRFRASPPRPSGFLFSASRKNVRPQGPADRPERVGPCHQASPKAQGFGSRELRSPLIAAPRSFAPPSQAGVPLKTSEPHRPSKAQLPPHHLRGSAGGRPTCSRPVAMSRSCLRPPPVTSPPAAHPSPPATAGLASPPSEVGDPPPAGLAYPPLRNGGARQGRASGLHLDWPLRSPPPRHRSTPSGGKSPAVRHAFFRMGAVLHPQGVFIRTAPTQKNAFREEGGQVDNSLGRVMVGLSENKRQYGLET